MTPKAVQSALEAALSAEFPTAKIAWPGVPFDPEVDARDTGGFPVPWMRPATRFAETYPGEKGESGVVRREGIFIVQVFAPDWAKASATPPKYTLGHGPITTLAGQVEAAFQKQDFSGVHCTECYVGAVTEDWSGGAWWQCNVTVPWWAWINE